MKDNWTPEQRDAIYTRNKSLLISAAAGSGKTAVLVERVLSIITDSDAPVDIDRLLVVTFTKAAAAEMKSRLRERLLKMQAQGGKTLQRQLALLPQARISTFDALCQTIVRENFTELSVDPSFTVGDDDELHVLREQALDAVFEESYESPEFRALVESVCGGADDYELRGAVLSIFDFIQSVREPEKWLAEKAEAYNVGGSPVSDTYFGKAAYESAKNELNTAISLLKRSAEIAAEQDGPTEYAEELRENTSMVADALMAGNYAEMSEYVRRITFENLKASRSSDKELREAAKELRSSAKDIINAIKNSYFFKSPQEVLADMAAAYPVVKTFCDTVARFSKRYMELKSEKRLLGFSDIKLLCYRALCRNGEQTDAAKAYASFYEYVMVDEYQDTNDVEEGILNALSRIGERGNRFMVGDVKQSIYRFRQAKPELFIEKTDLYGADGESGRLITLHKNFRSRDYILNGINFIFSQIMSRSSAEIEYDKTAALTAGAKYPEAPVKSIGITLIETDETPGEDGESAPENELKALEVEALHIAGEIYRLIYDERILITDGDAERPARLGDAVILMRSGKKNSARISDILSAMGIPSFSEGKTGWFELTEISDILSLLRIIDNPLQEIPLLTVLTSPIYNYIPDELIEIRKADEKGWFYSALQKYAESGENAALKQKTAAFMNKLTQYRRLSPQMTISALLTFLYDDTDYFIIAGAMENGRLRQANLQNLLKRAADFEKSTFKGLFHFVRYMERLKERDAFSAPEGAGAEADAIRIMTIHKSKGLEFPIVFLAGCGNSFNLRDLNDKFIPHQELGIGAVYVDYEKRVKFPTLPRNVIKDVLRRESLAEEMRLLYVAMTRAKEILYITGNAGADASKKLRKWHSVSASQSEVFSPEMVSGARSYMDWLMPAVMRCPSASAFLREYGFSAPVVSNDYANAARFELNVVKRSMASAGAAAARADNPPLSREEFIARTQSLLDTEEAREAEITIDKSMDWKYNYELGMPVKLTVSEIKTRYQSIISGEAEELHLPDAVDVELQNPRFMREERELSPSEKGTAVHTVLANVVFLGERTDAAVKTVMDLLALRGLLTKEEYESVNVMDIVAFLNSAFADRLRRSENVRREVPFVIPVSAGEAYLPQNADGALVHGIIDCFFEERGKIIIVDYKTDYVENENFEAVKQKYKIQLDIYRSAAGKITGKPVSEAYLYMLRYGRLVEM